jgi:hypothetical protein
MKSNINQQKDYFHSAWRGRTLFCCVAHRSSYQLITAYQTQALKIGDDDCHLNALLLKAGFIFSFLS